MYSNRALGSALAVSNSATAVAAAAAVDDEDDGDAGGAAASDAKECAAAAVARRNAGWAGADKAASVGERAVAAAKKGKRSNSKGSVGSKRCGIWWFKTEATKKENRDEGEKGAREGECGG
jgi:hypothetical protein